MIVITNNWGEQIAFSLHSGEVWMHKGGEIFRFSNDDARQLRRFLENLG